MSSYKSKFHKSLVCKFSEISISPKKNDRRSVAYGEALEGTKANDDAMCIEKSGKIRLRSRKSRKCIISILAGCGCQSGQGIVLDQIPTDLEMPEVCSVQSLPSCFSSLESEAENCPECKSSASFDEMLKFSSSSSSSTSHDRREVHYIHETSIEKNSLELHMSPVKFNDLINKLRKSEHISPKLSSLGMPNESPVTFTKKLVKCKVEKSLISKRKDGMMNSLLIMKTPCDPQREFKESMLEMIVENKIKDGKDMEELLAWFLYLNTEDYHDVIIQVFKQLWTELIQV